MKAPCYECENREVGCHATCQEYKEFQAENEEEKKKKILSCMCNGIMHSYQKEKFRRLTGRKD